MRRKLEIAWAAGFFDGEGTIAISRGYSKREGWGPYYSMKISASQRIRYPLDQLVRLFGGTVCKSNGRDIYIWTCATRDGVRALREMLPFLTIKRDQAIVAIAFQKRRKPGGWAKADQVMDEADRQELARLKRVTEIMCPPSS